MGIDMSPSNQLLNYSRNDMSLLIPGSDQMSMANSANVPPMMPIQKKSAAFPNPNKDNDKEKVKVKDENSDSSASGSKDSVSLKDSSDS